MLGAAALSLALAGCAVDTTNLPPPTSSLANDPVAQRFVSDSAVLQGQQLFRRTMADQGMAGVSRLIQRCERPEAPRRGAGSSPPAADVCLALDYSQMIVSVAMASRTGVPAPPNLDVRDVRRREQGYWRALNVPASQQQLVSDSTFQRVLALHAMPTLPSRNASPPAASGRALARPPQGQPSGPPATGLATPGTLDLDAAPASPRAVPLNLDD